MELILIAAVVLFVLQYSKRIDTNKFLKDSEIYFKALKEDDFSFLVRARYGEDVDPEVLFHKRLRNGLITVGVLLIVFISGLNFLTFMLAMIIGFLVYKMDYFKLKRHYRQHLHQIDLMLPYFLKTLEILIQHYTVPVALSLSIDDSPDIFKPGLRKLVERINAGDASIDPYMEFAKEYPVRDSMRMMRLLYRLSIGSQDDKQDQLLMFSHTVSNLQQKAREQKYKARLATMEGKTMTMLGVTGGGLIVILLVAMMMLFQTSM